MGQPTALKEYEIVRWTDTDPAYLGYIDAAHKWYIRKVDILTGASSYIAGVGDFATNWTNRASLTYAEYNEVF